METHQKAADGGDEYQGACEIYASKTFRPLGRHWFGTIQGIPDIDKGYHRQRDLTDEGPWNLLVTPPTPRQRRMLTFSSRHGRQRTPRMLPRIRDQRRRQYSHNLAMFRVPVEESHPRGGSKPASTSLHPQSRQRHGPRWAHSWFPRARIRACPGRKMQRQTRASISARRCQPVCHRAVGRLSAWGGNYLCRLMVGRSWFDTWCGLYIRSCNPARLVERFHLTPNPSIRRHDDGLVRRG